MILGHLVAHALGRTKAGQFFNMAMMFGFVMGLPIAAVVGFSLFTWHELAKETSYSRRYRDNWQAQYEVEQGSLSTARVKAGVAVVGAVINVIIGAWLYRRLIPALRGEGIAGSFHRRYRRMKS